jgi:type IV pilus assembly protein PilM
VDLPEDPDARTAEIQRSIAVAAAYYEDKLVGRPRQLHYAGIQKTDDFARLVGDPELAVVDMVPNTGLGATTALGPLSIAAISGALAGA